MHIYQLQMLKCSRYDNLFFFLLCNCNNFPLFVLLYCYTQPILNTHVNIQNNIFLFQLMLYAHCKHYATMLHIISSRVGSIFTAISNMCCLQGMKLLPTGRKSSLAIFMYSSIVSTGYPFSFHLYSL